MASNLKPPSLSLLPPPPPRGRGLQNDRDHKIENPRTVKNCLWGRLIPENIPGKQACRTRPTDRPPTFCDRQSALKRVTKDKERATKGGGAGRERTVYISGSRPWPTDRQTARQAYDLATQLGNNTVPSMTTDKTAPQDFHISGHVGIISHPYEVI